VSYQALVAQQADECGRIPGYQGTESMDNFDSYQYGCETQATLSQMINDPADLLGRQNPPDANSRRNGANIEPYMLGTPNPPLKGMSASTIGTQ
jgi:type IV pilus biogenesis protein CpaD/CtpE